MTSLLFIKLLRDLRTIWDRIMLMILALSITLLMFSAILYTWGITGREMSRAYLSTSPASATLLFEHALDIGQMDIIAVEARKQPGIIDATPRTQLTLQVQQDIGRETWGPNPLQIFVATSDDPMQIETFFVEQGSWPTAAGEILIDRSSLDLLNLKVGEAVVVQAPNGKPTSLKISGVVYVPSLAPSFQEQKGHGFISAESLPTLGEPVALNALKIQVADQPGLTTPSRNRDLIVAASRDLAAWLGENYGVSVSEIQVPTPYAHPHQAQADSLLLGLLVFGVAGLMLSAILVATMLNALFAQQIPQIGIMKTIGASSRRILQLYLLMILVISAASTFIAFIPGIAISRAFAPLILKLLGVDAGNLMAPGWMYIVVVMAGIAVPLLFSLASLFKTSRVTIREALDYRGVHEYGDKISRFGTWLGQLWVFDRTVLMAFRNIFRRRSRLLLSVGLLASAGAVFVGGTSTQAGFQASLARQEALRRWDVDIQLANINPVSEDILVNLISEVPNVTRVEAWQILQTSLIPPGQQISVTRTYPDQGHGSITVTVFPADSLLMTPPSMLEGRWLQPNEKNAVVVSRTKLTEETLNIHSGDTIQLSIGGRAIRWSVVGIAESVGHGGGIFITEEGFKAASSASEPNVLRIVTDKHDEDTRASVAQAAELALTDSGIVVKSAASVSRSAAAGAGHMLPLILVFLGLSVAMGVVGFAGLTSTMSTSVLERTREFGVMSAIGATASTVQRIIVLEGIFIALLSCLVAAIPAVVLTIIMMDYLPMSGLFQISIAGVIIWIVVVILGAALATLMPASQAARLTVREALTYL